MWSKFTHALGSTSKRLPDEPSHTPYHANHTDILGSVLDKHPNLSVFHDTPDLADLPPELQKLAEKPTSPSPPPSPGKRRGMLKRLSKSTISKADISGAAPPTSFTLPKKVRSHLNIGKREPYPPNQYVGYAANCNVK
jgi:hypothetical protein